MLNTFSSCKFIKTKPTVIATRDFLSTKLWDIRGTSRKASISINICDYLEKNLVNLYEDDSIYDRFFMDVSPCGGYILTGAYNKNAHVIDIYGNNNVTVTTSFDQKRGKTVGKARKYTSSKKLQAFDGQGSVDFKKKISGGSWHPKENIIGLAFRNCIFLQSPNVK